MAPHIHLELMKDIKHVSWDGLEAGGWTVNQTSNYNGYLEKKGRDRIFLEESPRQAQLVKTETDDRGESSGPCVIVENTIEGIRITFYCFQGDEHALALKKTPCDSRQIMDEVASGLGRDGKGGHPMVLTYEFLDSCGSGKYEVTAFGEISGHTETYSFDW
jgi:hypothetical protein